MRAFTQMTALWVLFPTMVLLLLSISDAQEVGRKCTLAGGQTSLVPHGPAYAVKNVFALGHHEPTGSNFLFLAFAGTAGTEESEGPQRSAGNGQRDKASNSREDTAAADAEPADRPLLRQKHRRDYRPTTSGAAEIIGEVFIQFNDRNGTLIHAKIILTHIPGMMIGGRTVPPRIFANGFEVEDNGAVGKEMEAREVRMGAYEVPFAGGVVEVLTEVMGE